MLNMTEICHFLKALREIAGIEISIDDGLAGVYYKGNNVTMGTMSG